MRHPHEISTDTFSTSGWVIGNCFLAPFVVPLAPRTRPKVKVQFEAYCVPLNPDQPDGLATLTPMHRRYKLSNHST